MTSPTTPAPAFPAHPIFDAVLAASAFEMMPLPEFRSHEQFMLDSGQPEFLTYADAILCGRVVPEKFNKPTLVPSAQSGLKALPAPAKAPAKKAPAPAPVKRKP